MKFSFFNQMAYELRSFVCGYPDFVYLPSSRAVGPQRPVFVFHTIDPIEFDEHLAYLCDNSYSTLTADEYVTQIDTPPSAGIDEVLLTVDDGRSSFWRYGYPLLKRYGLKATLFVIPGFTYDAKVCRLNLDDAWSGRCSLEDVANQDPNDTSICTWPEIEAMHDSGCVSIESHSLFHREVFSAPVLRDFVDRSISLIAYETSITPYLRFEHAGVPLTADEFCGLPLYATEPLYAAGTAFRVSEELAQFCREFFAEKMQSAILNGQWKLELRRAIGSRFPDGGLLQQASNEIQESIRADLSESTAIIQRRLGSNAGTHFCFPYSAGSDVAVMAAREMGIKSCFWGVIPGRRANLAETDPWHLVRIKSDFLCRLPGRGRRNLAGLYWRKVHRRVRGERFY